MWAELLWANGDHSNELGSSRDARKLVTCWETDPLLHWRVVAHQVKNVL
jgi:hypothetical protein